jgi:hypothetical protein
MNKIAWSASRVKNHKECPKKFYHMSVAPKGHPDRVEFAQGYAGKLGEDFHKMMQNRLERKVPFPAGHEQWEQLAVVIEAAAGSTVVEYPFALTMQFQPCGTKDWDNVWIRAVPDVMKVTDEVIVIVDWKSGKLEESTYQLDLCAAVAFAHYPSVQKVVAWYGYTKLGSFGTPVTHLRSDLTALWDKLLVEPRKMHENLAMNYWPARPGYYCGWCDVNKAGKCDKADRPYKER